MNTIAGADLNPDEAQALLSTVATQRITLSYSAERYAEVLSLALDYLNTFPAAPPDFTAVVMLAVEAAHRTEQHHLEIEIFEKYAETVTGSSLLFLAYRLVACRPEDIVWTPSIVKRLVESVDEIDPYPLGGESRLPWQELIRTAAKAFRAMNRLKTVAALSGRENSG
jgi:hypothetical protein